MFLLNSLILFSRASVSSFCCFVKTQLIDCPKSTILVISLNEASPPPLLALPNWTLNPQPVTSPMLWARITATVNISIPVKCRLAHIPPKLAFRSLECNLRQYYINHGFLGLFGWFFLRGIEGNEGERSGAALQQSEGVGEVNAVGLQSCWEPRGLLALQPLIPTGLEHLLAESTQLWDWAAEWAERHPMCHICHSGGIPTTADSPSPLLRLQNSWHVARSAGSPGHTVPALPRHTQQQIARGIICSGSNYPPASAIKAQASGQAAGRKQKQNCSLMPATGTEGI